MAQFIKREKRWLVRIRKDGTDKAKTFTTKAEVMDEAKQSLAIQGATALVNYSIDTASSYAYDFMMRSETFKQFQAMMTGAAQAGQASANVAAATGQVSEATEAANAGNAGNVGYGVSYAGIGVAYSGAAVEAGTIISSGGATGTSAISMGGGFNLTFSPVGLYIYAAVQFYQSYQAALACDEEDYKTATLSKGKLCYKAESFCERSVTSIFGSTCEIYRTNKCCYNSKLARIINEQGRMQLGLDMTSCEGFSVEELQSLDWGEINLTEFISDMLDQSSKGIPTESELQSLNDKIVNRVSNSVSTGNQPIDQGLNGGKMPHN